VNSASKASRRGDLFSGPFLLVLLRNKTTWFRSFCVQHFSTKAQTAVQRTDYHSNTKYDKQPIKIILLLGTHHNSQSESRLVKVFFGGKERAVEVIAAKIFYCLGRFFVTKWVKKASRDVE